MEQYVAEIPWLWSGLAAFAIATFFAIWGVVPKHLTDPAGGPSSRKRKIEYVVLGLMVLGSALLTIAIAVRWMRVGHPPLINMFEVLMGQFWSLGLLYAVVYWRAARLRDTAVVVLPVLWVMGTWILMLEPTASFFPITYQNNWKWTHIGMGKIFLAAALVGLGLAGIMLLRRIPFCARMFSAMPENETLDRIAWRFMMLALVFNSLMLIAGAVWAQDAWGRYWSWDPLETSSFLNWLALGLALHLRLTYRVPLVVSNLMIVGLFVFAFFTYFGAPYISPAAHKGMI